MVRRASYVLAVMLVGRDNRLDDAVRSLVKPDDIVYTSTRLLGEHLDVNRCAYAFVEADERGRADDTTSGDSCTSRA